MLIFWTLTAVLTALAGALVLAGARHGVAADEGESRAAAAELAELDRLKARGLMDEAGWTAARAESGRRILSGQRAATPLNASPLDRRLVLGGLVVAVLASLGLYFGFGSPGFEDQPYERRVQAWAEGTDVLEPAQVVAVIGQAVRESPRDHRALTILAAARFQADDPIGAASALRRAVAIQPDDAQSWARLGEALTVANDGDIGADAEAAFRTALRYDQGQLGARYFLGELALERGQAAEVRAMWGPLIATLAADDPRRADLVARLPQ